jgi:nitric oxide reductase NorE protein
MSTATAGHPSPSPEQPAVRNRAGHVPGEEGIWVFIFGDMLVFGILFGTYLYYRAKSVALFTSSQGALNTTFGLVNTLLLLFSSLLVVLAVSAVRQGRPQPASRLIAGAIACGLAFSVLKVVEYSDKVDMGLSPQTNNFYMFYFFLTGLHWFHLLLGLAVLAYMFFSARRPALDAKQFGWFEGAGCYWHMVDLLWIVLFPLLYLMN